MKKLTLFVTAIVLTMATQSMKAQKTIVDVAVGNSDFSTLVTALKAADLVSALQGDGPFTVFAPTNSAFAKIDKATLNSLLKPENKEKLASILTYHVVSGKFAAKDVVAALGKNGGKIELKALSGASFMVMKKGDGIYLKDGNGNMSKITATDVNGI